MLLKHGAGKEMDWTGTPAHDPRQPCHSTKSMARERRSTGLALQLTTLDNPAISLKAWSGKGDSNSRPSPWQGDALPLSYSRNRLIDKTKWRPVGGSNPCYRRERAVSWTTRRTGRFGLVSPSGAHITRPSRGCQGTPFDRQAATPYQQLLTYSGTGPTRCKEEFLHGQGTQKRSGVARAAYR